MSFPATVFKVMIASPDDVASERSIVREVLAEWNVVNANLRKAVLLPVGWETHSSPEMGDRPQTIINRRVLKDCDLLVGVFWTRIGTPTEEYASGTVEEIEEHIKLGKPVMLYFSSAPVRPDSVDQAQYSELAKFRESCKSRGILETYGDLNEFRSKFNRQLQLKMNQDEYFKTGPESVASMEVRTSTSSPEIPALTREAQALLKEASHDPHGLILDLNLVTGTQIGTNGRVFTSGNNPRERAIWEGAVEELENMGLIKDTDGKREAFEVTRRGFQVADMVNP